MIDDPALTWIELPPPPIAGDAVRAAAATVVTALGDGAAVTLVGPAGSGRRTAALIAAAELDPGAYLIPALPWRAPGGLRELARRLGVPTPPELSPGTLLQIAQGAMVGKPGLVIFDARIRADGELLAALTPPPPWRMIVLAPDDAAADRSFGAQVRLPAPPAPATASGDDVTVLAAAAFFDPWEGAPRALLSAVAGLDEATVAAAVARLLAQGLLRPARDRRRVLPTLHGYLGRPDPSDPTTRDLAERFVVTMASWCARGAATIRHALADDRANLMTSLSIWQEVAPIALVEGFAHALPMLLDDAGCHQAAKLVIQATRFGSDTALHLGVDANRRMGWSD